MISTAKEDEIEIGGKICRRIIAMGDILDEYSTILVKKSDKGGYIQSRDNLSENGTCWIYDDAKVYENAKVYDDAQVYEDAVINGNTEVYGIAKVHGSAKLTDKIIRGYENVTENKESTINL